MYRIRCFPPIIDNSTRLLILGSIPSEESLRKQQYYGNPRNQFWMIVSSLLQVSNINESYEQRVLSLKDKGIGLWDVILTCRRQGSLDTSIKEERANNFDLLYEQFPNIRCVCFNGLKAFDIYRKMVGFKREIIFLRLESTSPANTKKLEEKLQNWSIIRSYI